MKIKKLIASAMMTAMLVGSFTVASAEEAAVPKDTDTAVVTVENIEAGATVTAYKVVEAKYTEYGLTKYKLVDEIGGATTDTSDDKIKDFEKPTAKEITSLASDILAGNLEIASSNVLEATSAGTTYQKSLSAGSYIILVTDIENGEYVYNPLIVSVGYSDANDASTLKQTAAINMNADGFMEGEVKAYAKKSHTSLDKDIVDASTGNTETEDVAVGDIVKFTVTTTVPYYSEAYTDLKFEITDTADKGLGTPNVTKVTVGADEVTASDDTYTLTVDDNDWKIAFAESYIKANPLKEVIVYYEAEVTEDAVKAGLEPDLTVDDLSIYNKASLEYSTTYGETHKYDDTVSIYTFGFIGTKVDAKEKTALKGAEFKLTLLDSEGNETDKVYTAASDENGKFIFDKGMDVGTYRLVETKSPQNYALSDEVYLITFKATYEDDADGVGATITDKRTAYATEKMVTWDITIKDEKTGETVKEVTYDAQALTEVDPDFEVLNTKLAKLPSTGGNGAYIFTALGLIIVAGGAFFIFKKKDNVK